MNCGQRRRRRLDGEVAELNAAVLALKAGRRAVGERQATLSAFKAYLATDAAVCGPPFRAVGKHFVAPAGALLVPVSDRLKGLYLGLNRHFFSAKA